MIWALLVVVGGGFIVLGVFGPFLAIRCITSAGAGAKWISGLLVLETLLVTLPPLPIGINVYPQDLVFLLLGACAVARFFWFSNQDRWSSAWMLVGAVWIVLFAVGVFKFKTVAGVEFRPFYYFWSATAYFASFTYTKTVEHIVWNSLKWSAAALVLIACYRWTADATGFSSVNWGVLVGASPFRVLNSSHAHYLASILMLLLIRYGHRKTTSLENYLSLALAMSILLLQHRTVWILLIVALIVIVYREPEARKRIALPLVVSSIGAVLVIGAGAASGLLDPVFSALQRSVEEAFKGEGSTLSWRIQSWQELLRIWAGDGPLVNLFGYPFGNGWERYVVDLKHSTNYSPHSFYVQLLLRGGIVVFALFFGIYVTIISRLKTRTIQYEFFSLSALLAILVGQIVYCVTYGPGYMQGVFLGITFSLMGASLRDIQHTHKSTVCRIQPQFSRN